jgi:DNA-binding beta-propeller fold protein YncE
MNPYVQKQGVALQLLVSEPFNNTIAVIDLIVAGVHPNEVFALSDVRRISSPLLNLPVDLTPADIETTDIRWASNTTLEENSDLYVANRGNNTILRMRQDGTVVAIRTINVDRGPLNNASLNGIAASTDGEKIYVTVTGPGNRNGGVLELAAFQ